MFFLMYEGESLWSLRKRSFKLDFEATEHAHGTSTAQPYEWNKIELKFAVTYPKQAMLFREARFALSFLTHALLIQAENPSCYKQSWQNSTKFVSLCVSRGSVDPKSLLLQAELAKFNIFCQSMRLQRIRAPEIIARRRRRTSIHRFRPYTPPCWLLSVFRRRAVGYSVTQCESHLPVQDLSFQTRMIEPAASYELWSARQGQSSLAVSWNSA